MILKNLFEQATYTVHEIDKSDGDGLQAFCDFYNNSGQLSWQLTPSRLKGKLGSRGSAHGLYIDGELVGTVGLKQMDVSGLIGAEIGYLMIDEKHRSLQNLMLLYKDILDQAKKFDTTFVTTNIKNKTINTLLKRSNKFEKALMIKSPYSNNRLFVWTTKISNRKYSEEERYVAIKSHFYENIIREER